MDRLPSVPHKETRTRELFQVDGETVEFGTVDFWVKIGRPGVQLYNERYAPVFDAVDLKLCLD